MIHLKSTRRSLLRATVLAAALPTVASAQQAASGAISPSEKGSRLSITRLDWAGIKLETASAAAYIDAIRPDEHEVTPPYYSTERRALYALPTHLHGDHFDLDFLVELLGDRAVIFRAKGSRISQHALREQVLALWEPAFLPRSGAEMVAFPVPASDGYGDVQVGWAIRCGDVRIFHGGDGLWHGSWWDIGEALGPFDYAFLPINGVEQVLGRFGKVGHAGSMGPEEAVSAALALRASNLVPIHYGSNDNPAYVETPDAEARVLAAGARHGLPVRPMKPGAILDL